MPDRDLKINSLSRFSKQSSRLVLEEYSHCEVPAGCGGVVLRWRKPIPPIPMKMHMFYGNGRSTNLTLNGQENLFNPKIPVDYGKNVLTFEITDFKPDYAVIFLYCQLDQEYVRILKPQGETTILSRPDGTWRYSLDDPNSNWQIPDFDDSKWLPMIEKPVYLDPRFSQELDERTKNFYEIGALPIGIDTSQPSITDKVKKLSTSDNMVSKVYIRKTFTISEFTDSHEGNS